VALTSSLLVAVGEKNETLSQRSNLIFAQGLRLRKVSERTYSMCTAESAPYTSGIAFRNLNPLKVRLPETHPAVHQLTNDDAQEIPSPSSGCFYICLFEPGIGLWGMHQQLN